MKNKPIPAYHATRNLSAIIADSAVKPVKSPNVYLFSSLADANDYAASRGYEAVVDVLCLSQHIQRRWKPAYCRDGCVIKLKAGEIAIAATINVTYIVTLEAVATELEKP